MATLLLGQTAFFQIVNLKARDPYFIFRGRESTPEVVLILIDQKSLDTIPDLLLFWHPYYAEAIRAAAANGAKVLGLDVTFAIPVTKWEPNNDQLLAQAVAETAATMPVICGYIPSALDKQRARPVPINMIAAALGLSAYANLTTDPDDFVRRQELIEAAGPGAGPESLARGLAFRVAEKYAEEDARFEGKQLVLGNRIIPVSDDRTILINFAGPPGTVPRVSLSDFLEAARAGRTSRLQEWVRGKAVFLGLESPNEDRYATPFYTAFSESRWTTAGVEIQADTFHTLISGHFLRPASPLVHVLSLLTAAMATVLIIIGLAPAHAAAWFAGALAAIALVAHALFRLGIVLSTSDLLLASLLCLLGCIVYRFLAAEKRGGLFRRAIAVFVGSTVAESLEETEGVALSTSRQLSTILFSDIRGFTAFCEEKDPAEIVKVLNGYLGQMVDIIKAHHGHVNKFIGDGILAVFSDNDGAPDGDHVSRAVRCGVAMVTAPSQFRTGTGIHTGVVVVGNVGSAEKMEYTVLGDAVNTASRLEGLNKEYKTSLLMSASTSRLLDDSIETVCLGAVPIRGLSQPMELYTVASLVESKKGSGAVLGDRSHEP